MRYLKACLLLLTAAIPLAGCAAANKTGEVGNKNLRPYQVNDHERHGLPLNGVHSMDSPTYRLKSERHPYNHQQEWMLRDRTGNQWVGAHNHDWVKLDNELAKQIKTLPGVQEAYVMLTEQGAYVGVVSNRNRGNRGSGKDGDHVAAELQRRIIDRVKTAYPRIQQVWVTTNPEFTTRMKIYRDADRAGHPVKEFLAEFNALSARIFPAVTYMDIPENSGGNDFPAGNQP